MNFLPTKDLLEYQVHGKDGTIWDPAGFLFDTDTWKIEYIIATRGSWPLKKEYYLPIQHIRTLDKQSQEITLDLTEDQGKKYQYPSGKGITSKEQPLQPFAYWRERKHPRWIPWLDPFAFISIFKHRTRRNHQEVEPSSYLRNINEVEGYRVKAIDKPVGKVKGFVIDIDNWRIRYVLVDGPEDMIAMPPEWVEHLNPGTETLNLNLVSELVLEGPYAIS